MRFFYGMIRLNNSTLFTNMYFLAATNKANNAPFRNTLCELNKMLRLRFTINKTWSVAMFLLDLLGIESTLCLIVD